MKLVCSRIGRSTAKNSLSLRERAGVRGILFIAVVLMGCSKPAPPVSGPAQFEPEKFDGQRALAEAQAMVDLGPRDAGTEGAEKAALAIAERLKAHGVEARLETFTNATPLGPKPFRNVVGEVSGDGSGVIILGSHFDTKSGIPNFQGANDSASSCGALLELARVVADSPRVGATVRFVFFDGEECMVSYMPNDGFQGSRFHVDQLQREGQVSNVLAFILLDMIGDKDLTVTLPRNSSSSLLNAVLQAAHAEDARGNFSLLPNDVGDDHVAFLAAGIPAVDLIDFAFGSAPGLNDYWHTPDDTMDKISAESLQIIGRVTLRVVNDRLRQSGPAARQ